MRWFDEPPCPFLDVNEATPQRLFLVGPTPTARLAGGAVAAFGGVFASFSLPFLRLPVPAPFKLIPLAFTALGGGLAALGVSTALASCSVEVVPGRLTLRWKVPGRDERVFEVKHEDVQAFEVTTHAHQTSDNFGGHTVYEYRLVAVTKAGKAVALEAFGTQAQAALRKEAVERLLVAAPATGT